MKKTRHCRVLDIVWRTGQTTDLFTVVKALAGKAGQVKRCGRGNVALWAASQGKFLDFCKRLVHIAGEYLIPRLGSCAKD
jgi:hypothetical protein